jgi:DNA-binding GntR family transcriptional regulator
MTTTHAPSVDIPAALACLAAIGITTSVLAASDIDASDPAALRNEIERLLQAVVGNDVIADADQLQQLEQAYHALYTEAEPTHLAELATVLDQFVAIVSNPQPGRDLVVAETARRRRYDHVNLPRYGGACLEVE